MKQGNHPQLSDRELPLTVSIRFGEVRLCISQRDSGGIAIHISPETARNVARRILELADELDTPELLKEVCGG